ncbi:hypothetical protein BJY04DRAFT_79938 [Aspergillus karnatakaensis]|uniref:uncharacterized protein n=1 Tax=Aspergillus karnatakaensis TaxID=1810916 RepID=UPI003CCDF48C
MQSTEHRIHALVAKTDTPSIRNQNHNTPIAAQFLATHQHLHQHLNHHITPPKTPHPHPLPRASAPRIPTPQPPRRPAPLNLQMVNPQRLVRPRAQHRPVILRPALPLRNLVPGRPIHRVGSLICYSRRILCRTPGVGESGAEICGCVAVYVPCC